MLQPPRQRYTLQTLGKASCDVGFLLRDVGLKDLPTLRVLLGKVIGIEEPLLDAGHLPWWSRRVVAVEPPHAQHEALAWLVPGFGVEDQGLGWVGARRSASG